MTAVMTIEPINFQTKHVKSELKKGIDQGALYGLMRHNIREEYNNKHEIKMKKASHIDESKSHLNHYFKTLTPQKIEKLKSIPHRANQRGAFEIIFSFQDLDELTASKFYSKEYAKQQAKLIMGFLQEQGIVERFELLELVCHNDEGLYGDTHHPHFHLTFSGYDKIKKDWGYSNFFNPIVDYQPMKKNGEIQYKKVKNGKDRGKFELKNGNKIPKLKAIEKPIFKELQDNWNNYLKRHSLPFRNKKQFTSLLQLPSSLWRALTHEQKQKVYEVRRLEKKMNQAYLLGLKEKYSKLKQQLLPLFNEVILETETANRNKNNKPKQL